MLQVVPPKLPNRHCPSFGFGAEILHAVHESDPRDLVTGRHHLGSQAQEGEPPHFGQVALQELA